MLSFFPRGVLDEIWDLIESVSEGCPFSFYSSYLYQMKNNSSMNHSIRLNTCTHNSLARVTGFFLLLLFWICIHQCTVIERVIL